jgi:hypothetical protein
MAGAKADMKRTFALAFVACRGCQEDNLRIYASTDVNCVCHALPFNLRIGLNVHDPIRTELEGVSERCPQAFPGNRLRIQV